jgi:hypothetical protein
MRVGAILLSIWSGLNLIVAVHVTAATLAGASPPALALVLDEPRIARLDPQVIAVVHAQAALANPCVIALCLLVLVLVWRGVVARARWAWWTLVAALVPLLAFGFVSDGYLGHHNLAANLVSTAILTTGLALTGLALRDRASTRSAPR